MGSSAQEWVEAQNINTGTVPKAAKAGAGAQAKATAAARHGVAEMCRLAGEVAVAAIKATPAKPGNPALAPQQIVVQMAENPDDDKTPFTPGKYAPGRGRKYYAEFVPKGTNIGADGRHADRHKTILDSTQLSHFRVLYTKLQDCLRGRAKTSVDKITPESPLDILWVLRREFGIETINEKSKLNSEFHTKKWNPRTERLEDWAQRKHWILCQLKKQNPTEEVLNENMTQILWTSMPESWNLTVNHGRQMGSLDTFQKVIAYLRGYEDLEFPKKTEPSGRSYAANDAAPSSSMKKSKRARNPAKQIFTATDHTAVGKAFETGDFSGMTKTDFSRFIQSKISDAEERGKAIGAGTAPFDINFTKKGGKSGKGKGKGGKGKKGPPKDLSHITCYECQNKGHYRGSDDCPMKKQTYHTGQESTKKTKKSMKKNPAVGSAPYE